MEEPRTISFQIDGALAGRLNRIVKKTGIPKSHYLREMLIEKLEEMEDVAAVVERMKHKGKNISLKAMEKKLGLDN